MCGFRICLHVSALLWCLRTIGGDRLGAANARGREHSVCTHEVVRSTCTMFGAQRNSSIKRLAQALAAEEEDVTNLLIISGIATDGFSCEHVCGLAVAQVPVIFDFSFSRFAELARLRVQSAFNVNIRTPVRLHEPMGAAPSTIVTEDLSLSSFGRLTLEESFQEKQKDIERGHLKMRSRQQILLEKLLRAMLAL